MRQLLNVIYRKILYRIPLKFLLILLAVVAVFVASVKADTIENVWVVWMMGMNSNQTYEFWKWNSNVINMTNPTFCMLNRNSCDYTATENWVSYRLNENSKFTCIENVVVSNSKWVSVHNNKSSYCEWVYMFFDWDTFDIEMSSLDCQTQYNLIPISSVDQNYCTTNNLCPSSSCPVCPVGSWWVSSLYINDILHVGAPFIYMTIPQEIGWDYEYTQWWTNMLIDVEWYNVDYDKIEDIVNTQSYTPDEYDLNSIITNVIPLFVPGLVIILFIYFIFRLIKKIF